MESKESEERKGVQQGKEWLSYSKEMKIFEMSPKPCSKVEKENPYHQKKEKERKRSAVVATVLSGERGHGLLLPDSSVQLEDLRLIQPGRGLRFAHL